MFCRNCGKELSEGFEFCPACGAKVAETKAAFGREQTAMKKEETIQEKYFCFHGRLNRKRYILRSLVVGIVSGFLAGLFTALMGDPGMAFVVSGLFSVAGFAAEISLVVRRLHDLNHTGLLWLLSFIPVINFFLAIYLLFFKGTEGENQYGPDPLAR